MKSAQSNPGFELCSQEVGKAYDRRRIQVMVLAIVTEVISAAVTVGGMLLARHDQLPHIGRIVATYGLAELGIVVALVGAVWLNTWAWPSRIKRWHLEAVRFAFVTAGGTITLMGSFDWSLIRR